MGRKNSRVHYIFLFYFFVLFFLFYIFVLHFFTCSGVGPNGITSRPTSLVLKSVGVGKLLNIVAGLKLFQARKGPVEENCLCRIAIYEQKYYLSPLDELSRSFKGDLFFTKV